MSPWEYVLEDPSFDVSTDSDLPQSADDTGQPYPLAPITNYADRVRQVLSQFENSTRLKTWIRIFLDQVQLAEDALIALLQQTDLEQADGVYLDALGALVNQSRNAFQDEDYRDLIRARILSNKSSGTRDDLLRIYEALFGETQTNIELYDQRYGDLHIILRGDDGYGIGERWDADTLASLFLPAAVAGIYAVMIYQTFDEGMWPPFRFAPGDTPVTSYTTGFGYGRLMGAKVL